MDFLVGRNGEFDQCASSSVHRVRNRHRDDNSSLVLVLPYETAEYLNNRENFEKYYDSVCISPKASACHPKLAIKVRNQDIIDNAQLVICYVREKYGGAYQALKYAQKQNKVIINIFDEL